VLKEICFNHERLKQNGPLHPVLKHGPRSLTNARVFVVNPPGHNESEESFMILGAIFFAASTDHLYT